MTFSTKNLINSTLILFLSCYSFGQTKKYLKKNKKAIEYSYSENAIYARGITHKEGRIFLSNSDGSVHYVNIKKKTSTILFNHKGIDELRDIEIVADRIIVMHSGNDGKIILLSLDGSIKILKEEKLERQILRWN